MGMAPRMGYPQPVGVPMVQPMAQPAMMVITFLVVPYFMKVISV